MTDDIENIEIRRLHELMKQAAMYGPQTEPAILIEIQELKHKYRYTQSTDRKQLLNTLDYEFLMNTVAATLLRFNVIERNQQQDSRRRYWRQRLQDTWMITITILVIVMIYLQVIAR